MERRLGLSEFQALSMSRRRGQSPVSVTSKQNQAPDFTVSRILFPEMHACQSESGVKQHSTKFAQN